MATAIFIIVIILLAGILIGHKTGDDDMKNICITVLALALGISLTALLTFYLLKKSGLI